MKELNLPPFYVGQKVTPIKTSFKKCGCQFVKGEIYTVSACLKCSCGKWIVTVNEFSYNLPDDTLVELCHIKDYVGNAAGDAQYFRPVQENFQSISLEKILEKETSLISAS